MFNPSLTNLIAASRVETLHRAGRNTRYLEPTAMTTPIVTETRRNGNPVAKPAVPGPMPAVTASTVRTW
jgi:hypothetical protein